MPIRRRAELVNTRRSEFRAEHCLESPGFFDFDVVAVTLNAKAGTKYRKKCSACTSATCTSATPWPTRIFIMPLPMLSESAELSSEEPLDAMVTTSLRKNEMRCAFNALTDLRD